ncbi:MAG: PqqD family protein [Ornithinibacter sp.]
MTGEHMVIAAGTGWVERDGTVYAAPLPEGPPFVLAGAAAVVWRAVTQGGTLDEVTRRVADEVGSPPEVVTADVATFVSALVDTGLVERRPGDSRSAPSHD